MATTTYLTLTGAKQGPIKGGVTAKGYEGAIAVADVAYGIVSPRDPASGLPTGKRIHQPVTITKAIDPSTPQLLEALITNEALTTAKIDFLEPSAGPGGALALALTITLTNAAISALTSDWSDARNSEEVQFVYQKIEVTWIATGKTAIDQWNSQT